MSSRIINPVDLLLKDRVKETLFVVDDFYIGHKILFGQHEHEIKMLELFTNQPNFPRIQSFALLGIEVAYRKAQKILAEKHLVGKKVNIFSGENEIAMYDVWVINIQNPRNDTVLFEVGLLGLPGSVIISEKMKIQILD